VSQRRGVLGDDPDGGVLVERVAIGQHGRDVAHGRVHGHAALDPAAQQLTDVGGGGGQQQAGLARGAAEEIGEHPIQQRVVVDALEPVVPVDLLQCPPGGTAAVVRRLHH
jgi:hypothetical protein